MGTVRLATWSRTDAELFTLSCAGQAALMRRAASPSTKRLGDRLVAVLRQSDEGHRDDFLREHCEPGLLVVSDGNSFLGLRGLHAAATAFRSHCADDIPVSGRPSMIRSLIRFEWRLIGSDRTSILLVSIRRARIDAIYLRTR